MTTPVVDQYEPFDRWAIEVAEEARSAGASDEADTIARAFDLMMRQRRYDAPSSFVPYEVNVGTFVARGPDWLGPDVGAYGRITALVGHVHSGAEEEPGWVRVEWRGKDGQTTDDIYRYGVYLMDPSSATRYRARYRKHYDLRVLNPEECAVAAAVFTAKAVVARKIKEAAIRLLADAAANITVSDTTACYLVACELGRGREVPLADAVWLRNDGFINNEMGVTDLGHLVLEKYRMERKTKKETITQ